MAVQTHGVKVRCHVAPGQAHVAPRGGGISFINYIFDIFVLNGPYIESSTSCNLVHVRLFVILYVLDT